jgi:hypothetical protein
MLWKMKVKFMFHYNTIDVALRLIKALQHIDGRRAYPKLNISKNSCQDTDRNISENPFSTQI